jgi:hypothetical protein
MTTCWPNGKASDYESLTILAQLMTALSVRRKNSCHRDEASVLSEDSEFESRMGFSMTCWPNDKG